MKDAIAMSSTQLETVSKKLVNVNVNQNINRQHVIDAHLDILDTQIVENVNVISMALTAISAKLHVIVSPTSMENSVNIAPTDSMENYVHLVNVIQLDH